MRLIDLTGQRFGRLTVLHRDKPKNKRTIWLCKCDCGNEVAVEAYNLKTSHTQSCGCLQKEATSSANKTHGMSDTRLYRIWVDMHNRCYQKSYHAYNHYGGRGITICDEWLHDFQTFFNWAIENGYKDNLSIDRIDNEKGYSPDYCRCVTMEDQYKNKRVENGFKIKEI